MDVTAAEKRYSFPESSLRPLFAYLRRRPWEDVEQIMHALNENGEEVKQAPVAPAPAGAGAMPPEGPPAT